MHVIYIFIFIRSFPSRTSGFKEISEQYLSKPRSTQQLFSIGHLDKEKGTAPKPDNIIKKQPFYLSGKAFYVSLIRLDSTCAKYDVNFKATVM